MMDETRRPAMPNPREQIDAVMAGVFYAIPAETMVPEARAQMIAIEQAIVRLVIAELTTAADSNGGGCLCADATIIKDMPRMCGDHQRIAAWKELPAHQDRPCCPLCGAGGGVDD